MSFWLKSGVTDQYVYFTAPPGLSSFTVYYSRNGGAVAQDATPTVNETDSTNMPGVYEYLVTEDTTLAASNLTEHMALHISAAGWSGTIITLTLFDDTDFSVGLTGTQAVNTTQIAGTAITGAGTSADPWGP
jgi:hypothetical protein